MHVIVAFLIGLAVGIAIGACGWYRYGSSLKSKVATELSTFGNKPSAK